VGLPSAASATYANDSDANARGEADGPVSTGAGHVFKVQRAGIAAVEDEGADGEQDLG